MPPGTRRAVDLARRVRSHPQTLEAEAFTLCLDSSGVGASRPVLQGIVDNAPDGSRRFRCKRSAIWLAPEAD
jgi:hypothetical protein